MTATPCPICETDAEALPIPIDFDGEAFSCPAHGRFEVKPRRTQPEQLFSDLPPKADLTADIVDVS